MIKCLKNYDRNSHRGELWKAIDDVNHKRGVHSITMPWQMFGNQCRNSDNTEDINENDLAVIANNNLAARVRRLAVRRAAVGAIVGGGAVGGVDIGVGDDFGDDDDIGAIVHSDDEH